MRATDDAVLDTMTACIGGQIQRSMELMRLNANQRGQGDRSRFMF